MKCLMDNKELLAEEIDADCLSFKSEYLDKLNNLAETIDKAEEAINRKRQELEEAEVNRKLASETIDVTLPGVSLPTGGIHPLQQTNPLQRIVPRSSYSNRV